MDFFQTIYQRRSIRKYASDPIPDDHLTQMLEAARLAPSAGNYQPWKFVVVRDPKTIKQLARAARNQNFLKKAAAIIVAFADANVYLPPLSAREPGLLMIPPCFEIDVMIAIEHLILAATALGYGSCWVGAFNESEVKKVVSIPDRMKIVALVSLGVAAENPTPPSRKPLSQIVFHEKYTTIEDKTQTPTYEVR